MLMQDNSTAKPITIDKVFSALKHWRDHKSDYPSPGIPNDVWAMLFQLEKQGFTVAELRRIFSLSNTQYINKKKQLVNTEANQSSVVTPINIDNINFSEVKVKQNIPELSERASQNKKAVTQLKSTKDDLASILDLTTIIVECIRPDGHCMKIHTTTKSIDKVMQGFFLQNGENHD